MATGSGVHRLIGKYQTLRAITTYTTQYRRQVDWADAVLLESTHGDDFNGHLFYVAQALAQERPALRLSVAVRADLVPQVRTQLDQLGLTQVALVAYLGRAYCRLLASAHYLINDTSFFGFFTKQPFQRYINIWHGTPLKYLGKDDGDIAHMGNVQRNFYQADQLVVSNQYTATALTKSYNLAGLMQGALVIGPSPRNSVLRSSASREATRREFGLTDLQVFAYLPTWRGVVGTVATGHQSLTAHLAAIDQALHDDQVLFVKLHPFEAAQGDVSFANYKHLRAFPTDCETYQFLGATDGLITDYSSIMYDYMNTGKPIALFDYDKADYLRERGCYEDLDTYPFAHCETLTALTTWLAAPPPVAYLGAFADRFIGRDRVDGAAQLVPTLLGEAAEVSTPAITTARPGDDLPTTLVYVADLRHRAVMAALQRWLAQQERTDRHYLVCTPAAQNDRAHLAQLLNLPAGVQFYAVPAGKNGTLKELVTAQFAQHLPAGLTGWSQKTLLRMARRDYRRLFAGLTVDTLINFDGSAHDFATLVTAVAGTVKTVLVVQPESSAVAVAVSVNANRAVDQVWCGDEATAATLRQQLTGKTDKIVIVPALVGQTGDGTSL